MPKLKKFATRGIALAVALSACGAPPATQPSSTAVPTPEQTPSAATLSPAASRTSIDVSALEPQRIEFKSADGTQLVGTYWPPIYLPAPGIILMHMMGTDKDSWQPLPALLQGAGMAHEGAQQQSYAVLAFDFRGHGESEGDPSNPRGLLEDAKAALSTFRTMPGVDTNRIVLIGASIGADAAVDACGDGCVGAISLSPGSYLNVGYTDALGAIGDKPVLCVASESDGYPARTCREGEKAGLSDYQVQIYSDGYHGTDMFAITDQQPLLTDLIFEWLAAHRIG